MSAAYIQFKALSDPTRLRIACLLTAGELCVCDLLQVLRLPQSTVSRHVATLKQAGLVSDERRGRWVHYALASDKQLVTGALIELLETMINDDPYRQDQVRLKQYLETRKC